MKVGTHAQETLEDIIARKTKEIEQEGFAFWGYGGSTCHPTTMVQPFAKTYEQRGKTLYLCMERMSSKHHADPIRADEYSADGITWKEIPPAIGALGSRYALVISSLETEDFDLSLAQTKVAIGRSEGVKGSMYIKGRVDKACLSVVGSEPDTASDERVVKIGLVAALKSPYAVFLRNRTH